MYFCYFVNYLPLEKGRGSLFEQISIPFTHDQRCFVPSLIEIGSVVLEKIKMWKVYRRTDGRRVIRKAHLRFQLRWAKNEYYIRVAFCLFIIFGTAKGDPHPFFADHWGRWKD